jgi:hypothetical protein
MSGPTHLIIITHPGHGGLELFSAHHAEEDARLMVARMERLLKPSGAHVHLVEVPFEEGVVDLGELPPLPEAKPAQPSPVAAPSAPPQPPAEKPAPFRRMSRAEFAADTEAQEMNGGLVTDTPEPKYSGAFS